MGDAGGTVVAQLQGTAGAPHVAIQPAAVDLGNLPTGTSSEGTVTVTNTGSWPLTLDDPTVTGSDAADFTLIASCDGAVVQPGDSCTMRLSVTPSAEGLRQAKLRFTSNADSRTHEVPLTATGIL